MSHGDSGRVEDPGDRNEQVKTVICIDNSGSTHGCSDYWAKVKSILAGISNNKIVILWNSEARILDEVTDFTHFKFESDGGTSPHCFLEILVKYRTPFHLIVTTDGEIGGMDVERCQEMVAKSKIIDNILSSKIFFIGHIWSMNMKLSSLFNAIKGPRMYQINEESPIVVRDIQIQAIQRLTMKDFDEESYKGTVAGILAMVQSSPETRNEIRAQVCRMSAEVMRELAATSFGSIRQFFQADDVEGCVRYVKGFDNSLKKNIQQRISNLINTLTNSGDVYSLSHLCNAAPLESQDVEIEDDNKENADDDEELVEEEITDDESVLLCDILLTKIRHLCVLVKFLKNENLTGVSDEYSLIPDEKSKKYSHNPFLVLNDDDVVEKIVRRVEPQLMDLEAYNKLKSAGASLTTSPFSRDPVKGAFIFHSDEDDANTSSTIFKNNNRTLSFIFGRHNKLPGNKAVWNVIFLYILAKRHGQWKEKADTIKAEIRSICGSRKTVITLNPNLNPAIVENLEVSLWYIVRVAHLAFPNSASNALRFMESADQLLQFYEYVFDKDVTDVRYKVKYWNLWKYMIRNRHEPRLKLEVHSLVQNFLQINDSKVFVSGRSQVNQFGVEPAHAVALYEQMKAKENSTLFDNISHILDSKETSPTLLPKIVENPELNMLTSHVRICLSTCLPLTVCPITKLPWKECFSSLRLNYDGDEWRKRSYLRLFKEYCSKYKKYPTGGDDLLVFHSNKWNLRDPDGIIVYPENIRSIMESVMKLFSLVMQVYDVEEYLKNTQYYRFHTNERREMDTKCENKNCVHPST